MIRQCTCIHKGQDSLHGKGMRVFNPTNKGFRCTVCACNVVDNELTKANAKAEKASAKAKAK